MRILFFFIAILWSNLAFAEIPAADYSSLTEGTAFVYERKDGSRYQSKLTSKSADAFVFETRNGEDGSGSFVSRSTYTPNGKRLKWEGPQETWIYKPHGCNREIGDCVYKAQKSTGGKAYRSTVSTKYENGRATWKRYYNGSVASSGWYEIDPDTKWVSSFGWSSSNGGGETATLLRIEQP